MTPVEIQRAADSKAKRDDEEMQRLSWMVSTLISPHVKGRISQRDLYRSPFDEYQGPRPLSAETKKKIKNAETPELMRKYMLEEMEV